jgi:flagellar protein FliO/FliZ
MMRRFVLLPCLLNVSALTHAANNPVYTSSVGSSTAGSLFQVFLGLIAVLLLIAGSAWIAKRMGVTRGGSSSVLNVISSASVGTRERVVIVEVGESWLVVGVAPGSVNALMTLPKGDTSPAQPGTAGSANFAAHFQKLIEKRHVKSHAQ